MLALLAAIDASGIAGACRACVVPARLGRAAPFEGIFGTALLITNRRQGTQLSPAQRLLWANRRIV